MLTREDIDDLFDLIAIYRKNDKNYRDMSLRAVWHMTLEPYEKDDVREAVAAYFREFKYWPDVTDITTRCPPPRKEKTRRTCPVFFNEEDRRLHSEWRELVEKRRAAGIPATVSEAKTQGTPEGRWLDVLEEFGLQFRVGWET